MHKMEVANHKAFGEMIKAWTKGEIPLPDTIEEFASQLAAANIGATIPSKFKHVQFVQSDRETLVVRLPCKEALAISEERFSAPGGNYPLPAFYERSFGARPVIENMMDFHAERIGDYSIANCY